ncbi:hypothetical protein B0H14DRAFT_3484453 [Mycena olivaceomarginata]|nr:hypothetical protein B0H14DRAFT_3484453 [Mycena olivaceomarginata]
MQENKEVPIFEPKYLNEVEVAEITNLFIEMNSATVTTMVIKSTSIMKILDRIKRRDDEFGIKAKTLYVKWKATVVM